MPKSSLPPDLEHREPTRRTGWPGWTPRQRAATVVGGLVAVCLVTWGAVEALTGGPAAVPGATDRVPPAVVAAPREVNRDAPHGGEGQAPAVIPPAEVGEPGFLATLRASTGVSADANDELLTGLGRQSCVVLQGGGSVGSVQAAAAGTGLLDRGAAEALVGASREYLCPAYQQPPPARRAADGTYLGGTDIVPGAFEADGTDDCRWSLSKGPRDSLGDVVDSGSGRGPRTVEVRDGEYLISVGCGEWQRTG